MGDTETTERSDDVNEERVKVLTQKAQNAAKFPLGIYLLLPFLKISL